MRLFIIIIFGCSCLFNTVFGQQKEDLEKQKQKAFDEIELAKELVEKTALQKTNSVNRIRILTRGIIARENLINTMEKEIMLLDEEIKETQDQIMRLGKRNDKNKQEYAKLIYFAYRNHTNYEKLMYILASEPISQSYQRYKYLKYIAAYREQKANEIALLIDELGVREEQLNRLKSQKLYILEEKEQENGTLLKERKQKSLIVQDLQREEARLRRQIREKERIASELEAQIRMIIEEEAKRLNTNNLYASLTPEQKLVSSDFKKNKGKLPWPVERGILSTGFGSSEYPGLRGSSIKNNGIDISSSAGTMVRSVFEGEVTKVFAILGANYTVIVRHGEFLSVYLNLVNVRVKTGDQVVTKTAIGEAFADGENQVAVIHFEVWQERNILNPQEWLSK